MLESIEKAKDQYRVAAQNYMKAIREEYPKGTAVKVRHRESFVVYVIDGYSSSWWCDPERLHGYNPQTGKYKKFGPSDIIEIA